MRKIKTVRYWILLCGILLIIGVELKVIYTMTNETYSEISKITKDEFRYDMELVDMVFSDLKCFPVLEEQEMNPVNFENTWGAERTYGGERTHEGCDLMAVTNERGKYKICSMTDGIVKNIGWLEQGGWRIGIESDSGIYYYYAHLDSYEKAFEKGERVAAGQILGRMGDSGYGKEPGTRGNFPVHLHVGIYVKDQSGKERAINPFWYLKQLEI